MLNRSVILPRGKRTRPSATVIPAAETLLRTFQQDPARRFAAAAHAMTMVFGSAAMVFLAAMFFKPAVADWIKEVSPFGSISVPSEASMNPSSATLAESATPSLPTPMTPPAAQLAAPAPASAPDMTKIVHGDAKVAINREEQMVSQWLSRRYRVASDATKMMVSAAYQTARELKIDPLLVLSVMAIESRFNPFAESPVGAQGLMQVMSKVHHDKFQPHGGVKAALNPAANIRVGSMILKDYLRRGGSVEAALKMYVGAAALDTDFGYGEKVLAEYARLKDVALGKQVPVFIAAAKPAPTKAKIAPAIMDPAPIGEALESNQPLNVEVHQTGAELEPVSG